MNPCDEKGNLVLFPWVRDYDRGLLISSILAGSNKAEPLIGITEMDHLCRGVSEFIEGITSESYPAELLRRSPRGLAIPWTELVMVSRAVEFLPDRGRR